LSSRFVKLSHDLSPQAPRFPGNPPVEIEPRHVLERDGCNTFQISFFNHNGTHVDGPWHYTSYKKPLTEYPLEQFIFSSPYVLQAPLAPGEFFGKNVVRDKEREMIQSDILLLNTGHGKRRGQSDYLNSPIIDEELATWLRERCPRLRCLILDYISLTNPSKKELGERVHKILLNRGKDDKPIFVVEDGALSYLDCAQSLKQVFVVPWFIEGLDSLPCTIIGEYR